MSKNGNFSDADLSALQRQQFSGPWADPWCRPLRDRRRGRQDERTDCGSRQFVLWRAKV